MAEEIKTLRQELDDLMPELKEGIYSAEYTFIERLISYLEEKEPSVRKGEILNGTSFLEKIATNYTYYTEQPEAQKLLQKAIGLMKRIVEE